MTAQGLRSAHSSSSLPLFPPFSMISLGAGSGRETAKIGYESWRRGGLMIVTRDCRARGFSGVITFFPPGSDPGLIGSFTPTPPLSGIGPPGLNPVAAASSQQHNRVQFELV